MPHATQEPQAASHRPQHERRPILVAVGPTGGESALRMAFLMAERDDRPVLVVSVVEPPPVYDFPARRPLLSTWPIEHQQMERRQELHRRLHELGHAEGGRLIMLATPFGDAAESIAELACERRAKLIVMGSGPHGARAMFASGTPLESSRRAPCPVLVVGPSARALPATVVVATDFGAASVHAALQARRLMPDSATFHVVHAWHRISPSDAGGLRDLDDEYERALPHRFARMRSLLGDAGPVTFTSVARDGPLAKTILAAARALRTDVVVAGTRGLGAIDRLLLGSVSTALLRGFPGSVLLVPSPDSVERARIERHMTGTSTVKTPAEWDAALAAFARRNAQRRTTLEIDDQAIGAQIQESGYRLAGATYDRHDRRVQLMFERAAGDGDHLTRSIGGVRHIAMRATSADVDDALCIEGEQGSALLTFLTTPARVPDR